MPRVKEPKNVEPDFSCDESDIRFGTPKEVAEYRAARLKCARLIEIGAGVGFQTMAFSKTCGEVVAIEIDKRRAGFLAENMKRRDAKNVTVICGDALDPAVVGKAGRADIIFVDTERPEAEEQRTLESIAPSVPKILESYSKLSKDICIEVPPHLDLPAELGCEREFISLNGRLNRLDLYFGRLKRCGISVVLLPSGERLEGDAPSSPERASSAKGFSFLYETDPALQLSGLVGDIAKKQGSMKIIGEGRKSFLLSKTKRESPFLLRRKICSVCEEQELANILVSLHCGKALLRYSIEPKDYWSERSRLEKGLEGDLACHVFRFGDEIVVCE